ncbi:MAG: hypothetical protein NTZ73_04680 [Candidatus Diapherotrites archaeon]|nr:hypothetical protein [Candidatus Diapherotrites archaeon]
MVLKKISRRQLADYSKPFLAKQRVTKIRFKGAGRQRMTFAYLAYSPEFKRFVGRNRRVLIPTYKLIEDNLKLLNSGKPVVDRKSGITIQKARTGGRGTGWKTWHGTIRLKVTFRGKEFFVKRTNAEDAEMWLHAIGPVEKYLAVHHNRISGFNIRLLKPHLIYEKELSDREVRVRKNIFVDDNPLWMVTDFLKKGEFVYFGDYSRKYKKQIEVIDKLNDLLHKKTRGRVGDIRGENCAYHPKSNTIFLLDIVLPEWAEWAY